MASKPITANDGSLIDKKSLAVFVMEDLRNPPIPWNPSPYKSRTVLVEGGIQAKGPVYEFIVLNRECDRISELKAGRYVLALRQLGFARLDNCLVYKDKAGEFHYLYASEALKDQLYVKEPVATPEYLPSTDLIGVLRYVHSEDCYFMFTENEDGSKAWVPITEHTDKRLDEEIARATARENEIEGKARGVSIADNGNGSFTFTSYEGEESVIPTGKKVQSTDGTVEVTENDTAFDLSIQEEIDSREAADASLRSSIEAETARAQGAEQGLQAQIDAFAGALIYIGTIDLTTPDVTQAALDSQAQALHGRCSITNRLMWTCLSSTVFHWGLTPSKHPTCRAWR